MSGAKKLADKAAKLDFSNLPGFAPPKPEAAAAVPAAPAAGASVEGHRPKTAPGAMMAFAVDARSELVRENEALKARAAEADQLRSQVAELASDLAQWDGAKAARLLDPKRVRRSRWANRHAQSFGDPEFLALKEELASAGGNVQPIKVRQTGRDADGELYEIVFGHRRHQGCLELGLPVLAMVENLSDQGLFVEMDRENRARKNLSAWEQGVMYRRALDEGLFPSQRKLSEAVGADLSALGKALSLARLPEEVVAAFGSPLEIQFRWAKPLADAVEKDRAGVIRRAQGLARQNPRPAAKAVLDALLVPEGPARAGGGTVPPPSSPRVLKAGGQAWGELTVAANGAIAVRLKPGAVADSQHDALARLLSEFLARSR